PVGRIRAAVRAGRDSMRGLLLSYLPENLHGARVLDAGCGTGAMAQALAARGADVVAVDLSPRLVGLARERHAGAAAGGCIEFLVGDMLDAALGRFDHVVAMDSLIHYDAADIARCLAHWAPRTEGSLLFTVAPRTPLLAALHALGRLFPRGNRAPALQPVAAAVLHDRLRGQAALAAWQPGRSARVAHGFYVSQALELVRR
ncbi:MAG: magnesium protoporphyrin IX methyltransferase, partial [Burkholderiaceae bacterium]|nr:magnesium protoporphyrin IX methyltransferase [Burkholderiaceae bacterium]